MANTHRVDPRVRAYGKARIDVTRRAQDEREWQSLWREPRYPFPFKFGRDWKLCTQYMVDDFAAEIGFFIDVLGFPVGAFSPKYAQFISPGGEFAFGVLAAEGIPGTHPETISLQFMLEDLSEAIHELEGRGIVFEHKPESLVAIPAIAVLRTPHGVRLELWGLSRPRPAEQAVEQPPLDVHSADFWADFPDDALELEQPKGEHGVSQEDAPELGDGEDELLDEPVYVDEEEEEAQAELVAPPPGSAPPGPRLAFPTQVIRRAEDLVKGGLPLTGRKIKGNGMRGFPTLSDAPDGGDG